MRFKCYPHSSGGGSLIGAGDVKNFTPFLVNVPISASKRVSLIIFSAKSLCSGANRDNFKAHPLARMSASYSGLLKYDGVGISISSSDGVVRFIFLICVVLSIDGEDGGPIEFPNGTKDGGGVGVNSSTNVCCNKIVKLSLCN